MIKSMSAENRGEDLSSIDKIMTICCILINLGDSIVYKENDEDES